MNLEHPIAKLALEEGGDPEFLEKIVLPEELNGKIFFNVVSPQEMQACAEQVLGVMYKNIHRKHFTSVINPQ